MILTFALSLLTSQAPAADFPYQRFTAAEHSRVGYRGESTLHDFEGEVRRLTASLHADLARLATTGGGEIRFRVADLTSGNDDRDENMRSDLDAEHFPEIVFRLTGLDRELPTSGAGTLSAEGAFEIHGVTRARVFPVRFERLATGRLSVRGSLRFLQTDHGIEPHSTFGVVKVHDEVEVWFDLELEPLAGPSVAGAASSVRVEETTKIPGLADQTRQLNWRLWSSGSGALLEGDTEWWLGLDSSAARLDPRAGASLAAAPDAEQDFVEARTRLASLETRLAGMSEAQRNSAGVKLAEAVSRLRESLAAAPADGPANLHREGSVIEITLGDRTWARLEELQGDARVPAALAVMPNLPGSVRKALRELRGTPTRAVLLTASTAGTRELRLEFAPTAECRIPLWALDPAQWTEAVLH